MFLKPIPSNSHAHEYLTKDHLSFKTVLLDLEDGLSSGASLPVYHTYSFMLWFSTKPAFLQCKFSESEYYKWPVTLTKSDEIQSVWIKSHKNVCLTQLTVVVVFCFFLLLLFCFFGGSITLKHVGALTLNEFDRCVHIGLHHTYTNFYKKCTSS